MSLHFPDLVSVSGELGTAPAPPISFLIKARRPWNFGGAWASPYHCAHTHLQPFLGTPNPGLRCPSTVRRGEVCGSGPQGLPLHTPSVWPSKTAQAPCSSALSPSQQPPPHPQGPLPVPTSLFGFITLEGKEETFPCTQDWGEGSPPVPGAPRHPSKAHLLPLATPPAPPPSSHAYPPHPAGKEPRVFQASGLTGKEQRGGSGGPGGGPGEGGAQGAEEGAV